MKKIEVISKNKSYTAINLRDLDKLSEYTLIHPKTKQEIIGKVFLKDVTNATELKFHFQPFLLEPNCLIFISIKKMKKLIL